ncbi:MAG: hypothetical protein A2Y17_08225 [Clostridiales bacterium GWF2_38_85]|nr:MAG: hypothetical protein A2Y17_08225 [Clostridiales bacterium GWF2_38_85]HBL83821.1 hypothetical protein [Clostridiales bacterium]
MKRRTAFISICLCICMLMTMLTGSTALPVLAQAETATQNEAVLTGDEAISGVTELPAEVGDDVVFEELTRDSVPDIVGYEKAIEKGHIARLKSEEKDLYSVIFMNADGTNTMYMYADPVKYIDENGNVKDKSNKVVADSSKSGGYTNSNNDIRVNFPDTIDNGISLSYNDIKISMKPKVASKATVSLIDKIIDSKTGEKQTDSVKYDKVFGDKTYITYKPTYMGFKEDIILTEYTGQSEFEFTLYTNGLELYKDGDILFLRNENGETVANLGQVIIFTADNSNNSFGECDLVTVKENQEYTVIIKVDPDYLTDPKTVYPLTIDPTITLDTTTEIEDVPVYSGYPSTNQGSNYYNYVGYVDSSYQIGKLLMKFPGLYNGSADSNTYNSISASQIVSANLNMYEISGKTTASTIYVFAFQGNTWTESGATWNNTISGYQLDAGDYITSKSISTFGLNTFDIKYAITKWKDGTFDISKGLLIYNNNQSSTTYCKTFGSAEYSSYKPSLVITYNPTISISTTSAAINIGSTLQLSAITYPSGQPITWITMDSSIATVSSSGLVTGLAAGSTVIIVRLTNDASISTECNLTVKLIDGVYYIKNNYSNLYIHSRNAGITNGTNVYQYTKLTSDPNRLRQLWKIKYLGYGYYSIRPMHKLDMGLESNGNAYIWSIGTTDTNPAIPSDARWTISYSSNGYILKSYGNSNKTLSLEVASTIITCNINTQVYDGSTKQKWTFEQVYNPPSGVIIYNVPSSIDVGYSNTLVASFYSGNSIDQSITWSSSNNIAHIDFYGNVLARSFGTAIITATSAYDQSKSNTCNINVKNLLIYQTAKTLLNDDNGLLAEDLNYNDKTQAQLCDIDHISLSDFYGATVSSLRTSWESMCTSLFATQPLEDVILDMIDHFMSGSGTNYSNTTLTEAVENHASTQTYVDGVVNEVNSLINEYNGDIAQLLYTASNRDNCLLVQSLLEAELWQPVYNTYYDEVNGLKICIDSLWGNQIEISSYSLIGNTYSGTIHFKLYDHFGLDQNDIETFGFFSGFRSWYILQHYNLYNGDYKPFCTIIEFDVPIYGIIN